MDQSRVQCPVCTLYLHSGMSLESHLDTHPKDQVIKALCSLSAKNVGYGSRTSTPMHSERSFRSRSRTPATDDSLRWMGSHRSSDNEKYWRRTPSRNKSTPLSNVSRNGTPEIRVGDSNYDSNPGSNSQYSEMSCPSKPDKIQQTYFQTAMGSDYDQQFSYYPDSQEDKEVKFSKSTEYNTIDNSNTMFAYNTPAANSGVRSQSNIPPTTSRRSSNVVKLLPKTNMLLKTNASGVQYIAPGAEPMHMMMPTKPSFVQKNVQSNMIMTGNTLPCTSVFESKSVPTQLSSNQLASSTFTPGTTVVTQNSQIIYREMVHTVDRKPFSNMPTALSGQYNNTVTNVAQTSSLYQNVMVVDQYGNGSSMYPTPQIIPKSPNSTFYNNTTYKNVSNITTNKIPLNIKNDGKKTLIIEVSPIISSVANLRESSPYSSSSSQSDVKFSHPKLEVEKIEPKFDTSSSSKGLKILSNIKVEVPVQHHKYMLNTVMDLTGSQDDEYDRPDTPEKILPDLEDTKQLDSKGHILVNNGNFVSTSFSVLKCIGSNGFPKSLECDTKFPKSLEYDTKFPKSVECDTKFPKSMECDTKIETEFSDSCPVPDLICNEKPSISPCSELSELGDNSTDQPSVSPKPRTSQSFHRKIDIKLEKKHEKKPEDKRTKSQKNNALRLNNIFVKKHKKVLKIKNAKQFPVASSSNTSIAEPKPSSSSCRSPENYSINRLNIREKVETNSNIIQSLPIETIMNVKNDDIHEFDADTEEQSMDIEPIVPSSLEQSEEYGMPVEVQVKEEVNTSNEAVFNDDVDGSRSERRPEAIRPINVISYGNMMSGDADEDSNHKELLDLEAASKNKQFVSMMNENYFGDNIYADYFTPDRGEAFDAEKETNLGKNGTKDGIYIWGEPSQKEPEENFVLPNFIQDGYKVTENGVGYSGACAGVRQIDGDGDKGERDSKADVLSETRSDAEVPLNICADEKMPPRGELSGQESNGDMESPWSGMYTEVTPAEPYDLIARESWVSDGSEIDTSEKGENLEEDIPYPKGRQYTCAQCCTRFPSAKELRAHRAHAHAMPTCSGSKTSYSRLVNARIKKEEKTDDGVLDNTLATNLLALSDSKADIASTMLQVYDAMTDSKPPIEGLMKQETKRKKKDFVCPTCKEDQLNDVAFNAHLKIHPLECLTCGKCFFKRANLALHMKTHLGIKNYKCDVCEKRFLTRQKLSEHYNVHTGRAPFKCTHCDDTFRRHSNMVQHRDRHHFQKKPKIRDFVCHCGAVFHSRAKLLWHKETHEDKPKACLYCSDKFVHAASLTRHVRRSHNEYYLSERSKGKLENVPCPVCKQVYLRTNLRAHLQTHSGKRPYLCIVCNKSFTTKWNLKLHRWTHASRSAKPYKCNLCKGAFIRHTEYVSHMNAHKSVRPYTCNYCGCQFIRKYNCQRHVREHEMAKKHVCKVPECGKSFHRSYYLSEHMKVHSGARPFSCNMCGKTSSNKSNHNKHVKIHHARDPVATEA